MLHMILLILKIIGIVLLSLLGLVLLILALVLFVPVRYQLRVKADEGGQAAGNVKVRACVSWLLHLLHIRAAFAGKFDMVVRVCGIPIRRIPGRNKQEDAEPKEKPKQAAAHSLSPPEDTAQAHADTAQTDAAHTTDADTVQADADIARPDTDTTRTNADTSRTDTDTTRTDADTTQTDADTTQTDADTESQTPDAGTASDEDEDRKKTSVFEKLKKFFRAIAAFFRNIWYTIRNICDKIKEIMQRIDYYLDVLGSDEGRRTISLLKSQLGALLKHICPTKVSGQFQIGMEDPAAAGQIAAIAGMLYPIFGNHIHIKTVFGEKRFSGNLFIKGRIRVITLIRIAWRVYFNKDIKKFLRKLKREEKE